MQRRPEAQRSIPRLLPVLPQRRRIECVQAGLGASLVGLAACVLLAPLEEHVGQLMLFRLRGERTPPDNVLVVKMDRESGRRLGQPRQPSNWSRATHARLLRAFGQASGAVIAFDVMFVEPKREAEDLALERAFAAVPYDVVCMNLLDHEKDGVRYRTFEHPIPRFRDVVAGYGPFPLPWEPVRVNDFWTFRDHEGYWPTLPVVAFLCYVDRLYPDLVGPLHPSSPSLSARRYHELAADMRRRLGPVSGAGRMAALRPYQNLACATAEEDRLKNILLDLYSGSDHRTINYYGPSETIRTLSYHEFLRRAEDPAAGFREGLAGAVVFVGYSMLEESGTTERFRTLYAGEFGHDMSGVEIGATAFANLLDGSLLRRPARPLFLGGILAWGFCLGVWCRAASARWGLAVILASSAIYAWFAVVQFGRFLILPVFIPLAIQGPAALLGAFLLKYRAAHEERKAIDAAVRNYLPVNVADRLMQHAQHVAGDLEIVQATCLITDVAGFTAVAETMELRQLGDVMTRYFDTAFAPVRQHGGEIMKLAGDSMLAVWVTRASDDEVADRACVAALQVADAIVRLNRESPGAGLPTRIGVHCGEMLIGSMGAMGHYEYGPLGDPVNTASRIEQLNKRLGTRILASQETLRHAGGLLARPVGSFRFAGKRMPVAVQELLIAEDEADEMLRRLCETFAAGMARFEQGHWEEAAKAFSEALAIAPEDGPSLYYRDLCAIYRRRPPPGPWDGVVGL